MSSRRSGYTIVEVMVVLAVSSIIFLAVVTMFNGKQNRTQFSQAMQDIKSQVNSMLNEVGDSVFANANNYDCSTATGKPVLSNAASPGNGKNSDCVYLGKAVRVGGDPDKDLNQFVIYTVLGTRTDSTGSITTFKVDNFEDANPTVIAGTSSDPNLTESYDFPFGVTVKSAHEDTDPGTETDLMGFYNGQQGANQQGSLSLLTIGYVGYKNKGNTDPGGQVLNLVSTNKGVGRPVGASKTWTICFASGGSSQTATLTVTSSTAGLTSDINFVNCS